MIFKDDFIAYPSLTGIRKPKLLAKEGNYEINTIYFSQ